MKALNLHFGDDFLFMNLHFGDDFLIMNLHFGDDSLFMNLHFRDKCVIFSIGTGKTVPLQKQCTANTRSSLEEKNA
jgi:hypothetical protein